MKKRKLLIIFTLPMLLLVGCKNSSSIDINTIKLDKDGIINSTLIEDFDKDYYLEEELEREIDDAIAEFNSVTGEDTVTVETFKVEEQKVKLVTQYATAEDYIKFNNIPLFAGTIEEAVAAGYDFDSTFTKIEKGKVSKEDTFTTSDIIGLTDYKVMIVQETTDVIVPGNIAYISDGVTIKGKKTASFVINTGKTDVDDNAAGDNANKESSSSETTVGDTAADAEEESATADTSTGNTGETPGSEDVLRFGYIVYK